MMGGPQDPLSVPASIFSSEMYDLMNFFSTYINIMLQSQLLCKTDLRVHSLQKQIYFLNADKEAQRQSYLLLFLFLFLS